MDDHQDADYEEKIEKMITLTVAGAKGIVPLGQVALPLAQIANGKLAPAEVRDFARTLARILKGERDPITLVEALSSEFAELVWETLAQIEAPLLDIDVEYREDVSFEMLVEKVAEACTGEVMLWQQLWNFTEELSADERVPSDVRALGRVLKKILAGERQTHVLAELSPEHCWAVEQLLNWLNEQSTEPGLGQSQSIAGDD
ncbi:MAG TPA: hypothetical protein VGD99_18735 [Anaerolineae bacterium]|jgi:hypothetical protein